MSATATMIVNPRRDTRTLDGVPLTVTVRRLGYRVAYRVLQVVWLVTRPRQKGVKCLVWHGGEILLVRHSYGARDWDLPGGMVKRGEHPQDTAAREMREELGIRAPRWADLGSVSTSMEHRRDTIHLFGAELVTPSLTIDRGELDVARWFAPGELPPMRPLAAQILQPARPLGRAAGAGARAARPPSAGGDLSASRRPGAGPTRLLPLDRAGRLGRDVQHHPTDGADLVDHP